MMYLVRSFSSRVKGDKFWARDFTYCGVLITCAFPRHFVRACIKEQTKMCRHSGVLLGAFLRCGHCRSYRRGQSIDYRW